MYMLQSRNTTYYAFCCCVCYQRQRNLLFRSMRLFSRVTGPRWMAMKSCWPSLVRLCWDWKKKFGSQPLYQVNCRCRQVIWWHLHWSRSRCPSLASLCLVIYLLCQHPQRLHQNLVAQVYGFCLFPFTYSNFGYILAVCQIMSKCMDLNVVNTTLCLIL